MRLIVFVILNTSIIQNTASRTHFHSPKIAGKNMFIFSALSPRSLNSSGNETLPYALRVELILVLIAPLDVESSIVVAVKEVAAAAYITAVLYR